MRMITGILLLIIAALGTLYFKYYRGDLIEKPWLWYLGFLGLDVIGFLLLRFSMNSFSDITEEYQNAALHALQVNAEKITIDSDQCEFKSGSFSRQVQITRYDTATEQLINSYFTFTTEYRGQLRTFISHSFPVDETTLKFYVITGKIVLYVSRADTEKYVFEYQA